MQRFPRRGTVATLTSTGPPNWAGSELVPWSFRFVSFRRFRLSSSVRSLPLAVSCHRRFLHAYRFTAVVVGRVYSQEFPTDSESVGCPDSWGRYQWPIVVSRISPRGRTVDPPSARIVPDPLPGRHAPESWGATGASARTVIGADARGLRPRLPAVPCGSVVSVRTSVFSRTRSLTVTIESHFGAPCNVFRGKLSNVTKL